VHLGVHLAERRGERETPVWGHRGRERERREEERGGERRGEES